MGEVLLTGASGFIGGAILERMQARARPDGGPTVRVLEHRRPVGGDVEVVRGDLGAPRTLRGLCAGVETVIHTATHIGEEEEACQQVNARGTEALVEEAVRAGVRRLVYVSNAAVCGWAVQSGEDEAHAAVAPVTPVSRSRVAAERAVLAAGGLVLRPLFVYGEGDTRFVPTMARALARLRFLVDGGRARVSVIAVDELAAAICDLVAAPSWAPGVMHANDGQPVSLKVIVETLAQQLGTPVPWLSVPWPVARRAVRCVGRRTVGGAAGRTSAEHRAFLVSRDHYFDSARLWQALGRQPGPPFTARLGAHRAFYARILAGAA